MKNYLFGLLTCLALAACSPSGDFHEDSENEPPIIEEEFAQYIVPACTDFIDFGDKDHFLLYLRSKGYDKNNDGKISCEEGLKIVDLHFDYPSPSYVEGIEQLLNLKSITGDLTNTSLNLYNNSNLEIIDLEYPSDEGISHHNSFVLPKEGKLKIFRSPFVSIDEIVNLHNQKYLEIIKLGSFNTPLELDFSRLTALTELQMYNWYLDKVTFGKLPLLKKLSF